MKKVVRILMSPKYLYAISVCAILICIGIYFYIFHEGLSHHSNDWGNFGGYIGGVSALVLSSLAVYWAWYAFRRKNEDQVNQKIFESLTKSVGKLNDLRYELIKLTEYNGFSKSEQDRIKNNISIECNLILSHMKFVHLQSSDSCVKSVEGFQKQCGDKEYECVVERFSELLEDNIKNHLTKDIITNE